MLFAVSFPKRRVVQLLVLGLFCLVHNAAAQRVCEDVPVHVDVDIQPSKPVRCDKDHEATLRQQIQNIVNKKFAQYRRVSIFDSIDVGKACKQRVGGDDRRGLQRFIINGGWDYEFGVSCRFCNVDDTDPTGLVSMAPSSSPAPSSTPSSTTTNWSDDIMARQILHMETTLTRQLTRKLTQKVNKNPKPCFRGTDSNVTILVEVTNYQRAFGCSLLASGAGAH